MIGYLKLGAAAVVLGLLAWLGFIVNGWRTDAARVPVLETERDQALADRAAARKQFVEVQEISNDYQTELAMLRDVAARERIPVVRLCSVSTDPESRPVPTPERRPDAATPSTGELSEGTAQDPGDIAPDLFALADRADQLSAQVRGLQAHARGCAGQ